MLLSLQRHKGCEEPRGHRDGTSQRQETGTGVRDNRGKQMQIWVKTHKTNNFLVYVDKGRGNIANIHSSTQLSVSAFHGWWVWGQSWWICATNHHCQASWGTKHVAPYRHFPAVIDIMHIVNTASIDNCTPIIAVVPQGFQICRRIMQLASSLCNASYPPDRKHTNRKSRFDGTKMLNGEFT